MTAERSQYLAYLLRMWQAGSGEGAAWRGSLEDAHTGECHGFSSLEDLFVFLRKQIGTGESTSIAQNGTGKEMSL